MPAKFQFYAGRELADKLAKSAEVMNLTVTQEMHRRLMHSFEHYPADRPQFDSDRKPWIVGVAKSLPDVVMLNNRAIRPGVVTVCDAKRTADGRWTVRIYLRQAETHVEYVGDSKTSRSIPMLEPITEEQILEVLQVEETAG